MRFIVSSGSLLKNLQNINGIVSTNTVLSVLEDFLFELKGNTLTLTATDLETMVKVSMEVNDAKGDGEICIPSKILVEYLKNLPEQPVTFNINEKELSIEMSSDVGKSKIGGEKSDEFPKEPPAGETTNFSMPAINLVECINNTLFAVSNDSLRPAMTGVYFDLSPEKLTVVSTDAHRLVKYSLSDVSCPETQGLIVPKKPLQQLRNTLPTDATPVEISYNSNHLFVKTDALSLSCRLLDARYPDYNGVIPKENPFNLSTNRADLISSLKRVSIFSSKTTSQVVFEINGNSLQLSAQDIDFSYEGTEKLNCQYSGEDMKIGFNARLLIELLSNLTGEEVILELSSPSRAGILKPSTSEDNEDILMLIMPLMVGA